MKPEAGRAMMLSNWPTLSIDKDTTTLLYVILLFVGGFLVTRLFYGWIDRAGLQSADFSPTLASILTMPILAFVCGVLGAIDFVGDTIGDALLQVLIGSMLAIMLFAPVIPVLSVLLIIYFCGGFRGRKKTRLLWAAAISLPIFDCLWIYFTIDHLE
jgi:quinol-cytochrome oxidoreductase complex cytochrome b subunit